MDDGRAHPAITTQKEEPTSVLLHHPVVLLHTIVLLHGVLGHGVLLHIVLGHRVFLHAVILAHLVLGKGCGSEREAERESGGGESERKARGHLGHPSRAGWTSGSCRPSDRRRGDRLCYAMS